jgi:methyltransferase
MQPEVTIMAALDIDSRVAYTVLVALVAVLRLGELELSRRNVNALKARRGFEVGAGHYPWMVLVHASFLAACGLEVWRFDRPWLAALGVPMLGLLAAGMGLRYWTIRTLGVRWTTRVIVVPGEALARTGPYRLLRHPNYLAVVVEMAALPLVHTAWITAVVFSVLNGMLLRERIRVEDAALSRWSGVPGRAGGRA